jgi:ribosomal protein L37E
LFEVCPIKKRMCGFCGYDKEKILRCGFATPENRIVYLTNCPLDAKRKRKYKYR